MSMSEAWRDAIAGPEVERPPLPEQDLLREPDRLRAYTDAFLRGDIDVTRYNALTLAELNRRVPMVPDVPTVRPAPHSSTFPRPRVVQPVIRPTASAPVAAAPAAHPVPEPTSLSRSEQVRSHVAAYVRGDIDSDEFLRRVRDH